MRPQVSASSPSHPSPAAGLELVDSSDGLEGLGLTPQLLAMDGEYDHVSHSTTAVHNNPNTPNKGTSVVSASSSASSAACSGGAAVHNNNPQRARADSDGGVFHDASEVRARVRVHVCACARVRVRVCVSVCACAK